MKVGDKWRSKWILKVKVTNGGQHDKWRTTWQMKVNMTNEGQGDKWRYKTNEGQVTNEGWWQMKIMGKWRSSDK